MDRSSVTPVSSNMHTGSVRTLHLGLPVKKHDECCGFFLRHDAASYIKQQNNAEDRQVTPDAGVYV
jgi:hypothetical protein